MHIWYQMYRNSNFGLHRFIAQSQGHFWVKQQSYTKLDYVLKI